MTGVPSFTALTDNSKKAYYKEFRKVMEAADVVLEVLDARDPLGCRCKQIEEMIQAKWPTKKIVFVLNKIGMSWSILSVYNTTCSAVLRLFRH
jgi:ribosome biogenesis GTPase A